MSLAQSVLVKQSNGISIALPSTEDEKARWDDIYGPNSQEQQPAAPAAQPESMQLDDLVDTTGLVEGEQDEIMDDAEGTGGTTPQTQGEPPTGT